MARNNTVKVVRIPETDDPVEIVALPLMRPASFGFATSYSVHCEKYLAEVPDPRQYSDWQYNARKSRVLVDLGNLDPDEPLGQRFRQRGPYFMYKFANPYDMYKDARGAYGVWEWKPNAHFFKVEGTDEVYGNAFIFKVNGSALERGVVEYEDLDKSLISSAFKGRGIAAKESLKWLSRQ